MGTAKGAGSSGKMWIDAVTPYVHVQDVEGSVAFYAMLGFVVQASHAAADGRMVWASVACGAARIMLARASGPIVAADQAILLYMHGPDVQGLRSHLVAKGVRDGGAFTGQTSPGAGRSRDAGEVFDVARPFYMPAGEVRVHDPDGYVLLIGQLK